MTPLHALLAARPGIGLDDLALVVFFLIVAVLKLLQKVLQRRKGAEPPAEQPHRAPREAPPDGRTGEGARRAPVPAVPAPRAAPRAAHLADLQGIARGERADLSRREAEPAARAAAPPSGRALLLARELAPRDRLRQAVLWTEVLRRPRPVLPPRR